MAAQCNLSPLPSSLSFCGVHRAFTAKQSRSFCVYLAGCFWTDDSFCACSVPVVVGMKQSFTQRKTCSCAPQRRKMLKNNSAQSTTFALVVCLLPLSRSILSAHHKICLYAAMEQGREVCMYLAGSQHRPTDQALVVYFAAALQSNESTQH